MEFEAFSKGGGSEMALDYGDSHSHQFENKRTLSEQLI